MCKALVGNGYTIILGDNLAQTTVQLISIESSYTKLGEDSKTIEFGCRFDNVKNREL